ncbi:zinc metalloprotease ZmpD [Streptococcus pneumoniae]|nr:zinc metalloprotease ZmpD [Streptococcus pneumoniae]VQE89833.1 zinc metalloprotease ZmpD [Streptococcus pneumoniae]VQG31367.1 zinc metalloprotease ZmpD [Streptococcus pneumoniae]VQK34941.1 zinc metalloprotease ZmpD [Streptococcus pneumoniae]VQL14818.1 zinc metalloprotease ZmpD [Streptococcus pneumoniae]
MSLLKKDKFSIRKIKGIVGSVFLGSLLFAPSVIGASTYHYLDYSSLTQTERDQLKQGRPDESKESYALDYEKDALPNTGSSQSIMTALGLLAIGSLIVIITKDNRNKKIATFLIVGATGLVTLSTASALNLNANIHESGRDGVLQISGYRYVGYLELDDKTVSSVSPASTVSPVEQPKVVTEKGEPEVQPALPEAVVTDKGEPEVQPTLPEAVVTDKGEPEVHEKPDYTQPIGANLVEPEVHEKLAYTEPVGTTGVDENGNLIEPPVNDIPEYTEPISTVSEVASEREELPSLHTDIRTETIPKTTIEESDPSKFIGDDSVKEVGEDGERQIVTSYEELHGKKISEPVETVTILKEMKPKILVKGTKENPKEKTVPVLTLTKVTEDAMNRSANLNYELDNKDNAEISSIIAEIKDGDTVVKKVDLSKEKLTDAVQNLDLFIDDLVNNNLMTKHGAPSDRTYNPEDFDSAYVNINIMTGIYGGNTSQGAPGAASFKHNTFRMWGYFGYENGFISYASSKYQGEADKTNKKLLGDDFIIKKVSKDKFNNLEEWKKQYFKDVKSKAEKGFTAIEIDGRQITNYAQLKTLFAEAVQKDIDGMSDPKIKDHFKNTVDLKSKVFKALLKNTDGFFNKLFKEDI